MIYSLRDPYLWKTTPDGRRLISWRAWVLVWVTPVLFALAALVLLGEAALNRFATIPAEGEVVRVYAYKGETIFDRGTVNYAPVFRYRWSDGALTEAATWMSHPEWDLALGSRHQIRYFPKLKTNVVMPGAFIWAVPAMIGAIAVVIMLPALWATRRMRRWRRGEG